MRPFLLAGALALAAIGMSACATGLPLTGNPKADAQAAVANVAAATNPQAFLDGLAKFNQAAGQVCGGWGNFDWTPPLPPTGSIHAHCAFGAPQDPADPAALKATATPAPNSAPASPAGK